MIVVRTAASTDLPFLERTFIVALRDAITDARGCWDEDRERRQFRDQLQRKACRSCLTFLSRILVLVSSMNVSGLSSWLSLNTIIS
jgi:hypothetical protein